MRIYRIGRIYLLVVVVLLAACKDDDVPALEYQRQGSIKGTISGTASDDKTTINQSFEYTQFAPGLYPQGSAYSYYRVESTGGVSIRIIRQDLATGGYMSMYFTLSSETDTSPGVNYTFQYITSNNPVINFNMESGTDNTITITDFSFEKSTGRVKGKFVITGTDNSTSNEATITGELDVEVKEMIQ